MIALLLQDSSIKSFWTWLGSAPDHWFLFPHHLNYTAEMLFLSGGKHSLLCYIQSAI